MLIEKVVVESQPEDRYAPIVVQLDYVRSVSELEQGEALDLEEVEKPTYARDDTRGPMGFAGTPKTSAPPQNPPKTTIDFRLPLSRARRLRALLGVAIDEVERFDRRSR